VSLPPGHTWRPMRQQDAALVAERSAIYTSALLGFAKHSPEDVANYLRDPGINLATDAWVVLGFDGEFDVVGAFDVLEHIADDETVLRAMHRALCPGGGVLITVPQHPALWSAQDEHAGHRRRYTKKELVAKLRAAGFADMKTTSFVSLLLPLMALARLRKRKRADPFDELRIGGLANRVLEAVLDIERGLIRLGVSFPAGGSLLAVARKGS